jgi:hypothetical protein
MRFMFSNIRGFGKLARRRQIREYLSEENMDGMGLQETMKESFSDRELQEISGGAQFKWCWKGLHGHSSGILMGIKEDVYEMEDAEVGEFYVSMVLRHRTSNLRWEIDNCVWTHKS